MEWDKRLLVEEDGFIKVQNARTLNFKPVGDWTIEDQNNDDEIADISTEGLTGSKSAYRYSCATGNLVESTATVVFSNGLCKSWSDYV